MTAVVHVHEMTPNTQLFTGKLMTIGVVPRPGQTKHSRIQNVIYVMEDYHVPLVYDDAAPLS
jgi:hypothetical protein